MLRSNVAIVWPELANVGPAMLGDVALRYCYRLAGALGHFREIRNGVIFFLVFFFNFFPFAAVLSGRKVNWILFFYCRMCLPISSPREVVNGCATCYKATSTCLK